MLEMFDVLVWLGKARRQALAEVITASGQTAPTGETENEDANLQKENLATKEGLTEQDVAWLMIDLGYPEEQTYGYAPLFFQRFWSKSRGKIPYNNFIHACLQDVPHSTAADPFLMYRKLYGIYRDKLVQRGGGGNGHHVTLGAFCDGLREHLGITLSIPAVEEILRKLDKLKRAYRANTASAQTNIFGDNESNLLDSAVLGPDGESTPTLIRSWLEAYMVMIKSGVPWLEHRKTSLVFAWACEILQDSYYVQSMKSIRSSYLLPCALVRRSAIQKKSYVAQCRFVVSTSRGRGFVGDVPWRRPVGEGGRTSILFEGPASEGWSRWGYLPGGGSRWTCLPERVWGYCCIVREGGG